MLHASVRAVGAIASDLATPPCAQDALSSAVYLILYASCPAYVDEVGRGHLTQDQERELLEKLPAFDPFTARAQHENGTLVEFLRTYPGSTVNEHVTRFVVGKAADLTVGPTA